MAVERLVLVDSNNLRLDDLRQYLEESQNNAIALDRLVIFEVFKKNPELTATKSFSIIKDFPDQVYVLRVSNEWPARPVSWGARGKLDLVDLSFTDLFRCFLVETRLAVRSENWKCYVSERHIEAKSYINRLEAGIRDWLPSLRDHFKGFSQEEVSAIRVGTEVPEGARAKLTAFVFEVTTDFIQRYQEPERTEALKTSDALNMFAFRYALCVCLYYINWIKRGQPMISDKKLINDAIDLQIATVATFFAGLGSNDARLKGIATSAMAYLYGWGADLQVVDD